MSLRTALPCLALLALPAAALAGDVDRLPTWERQAYALIVPTVKESQWKRIPWVTDLDEAVEDALEEKRPLLLWTAGDDPLERC